MRAEMFTVATSLSHFIIGVSSIISRALENIKPPILTLLLETHTLLREKLTYICISIIGFFAVFSVFFFNVMTGGIISLGGIKASRDGGGMYDGFFLKEEYQCLGDFYGMKIIRNLAPEEKPIN